MKWKVKVNRYKGQVKVCIPKELSRLARLQRCKYVQMDLDRTGNIIMEAFDAREHRKVEGRIDQVGFN
ncbi:unnamed protein product [marine sediment metagenome]|uniref:SpoVT-AbrB domain-containing protein n=1 Tax=marine sediment metagenome TaxID=412755 RepID=X1TNQ9_9ZZZZ